MSNIKLYRLSGQFVSELTSAAMALEKPLQVLFERYEALKGFLISLDDDVQEQHLKRYVALKRIRNFACVELRNQKNAILVFLQPNPSVLQLSYGFARDISNIGHYGTGNIEITITSDLDLERATPLIQKSYEAS